MGNIITTLAGDKRKRAGLKSYSASVQADIAAPQVLVFEHNVPIDLTSVFIGYGLLPAVVGTRDQTGAWDAAGQTRTVIMSDGSSAQEQLTGYEYPHHFSYSVSNFTGVLRIFVISANGEWGLGRGLQWRALTSSGLMYLIPAPRSAPR